MNLRTFAGDVFEYQPSSRPNPIGWSVLPAAYTTGLLFAAALIVVGIYYGVTG